MTDTNGGSGPDVFSALDAALEINLLVPAGASGSIITVTTAGGSATLNLADVAILTVPAEAQGAAAADGVGGTLGTASNLAAGPHSLLTVTGRISAATDVDLFHLVGARAGGLISLSATGAQSTNARFRIFDQNGNALTAVVGSLSRFVLPPALEYYVGYSSNANTAYNVVDGSGTGTGFSLGDYALTIRYADPGVTSLNSIAAVATSGSPADPAIPSANTRQTLTILGENFTSTTRVRFVTFSGDRPQDGLTETTDLTPTSVALDGTSLQVDVPDNAVTGIVRLSDEPAGLILQIVPTVADIDVTGAVYGSGNLRLAGGGFIEGAQSLLLGTTELQDVWRADGPNAFNTFATPTFSVGRVNAGNDFGLPPNAESGTVRVKTLGGTSSAFPISFIGISVGSVAGLGTPANAALPSANVNQPVRLLGAGFDLYTEIIFPVQPSGGINADLRSTKVVKATQVSADGTSLQVVVPHDAATGNIRIVGASGSFFLQIVPTVVQVQSPATFATGQTMTILGSGLVENEWSWSWVRLCRTPGLHWSGCL